MDRGMTEKQVIPQDLTMVNDLLHHDMRIAL
jgi:hypothetical protein